MKREEYLKRLSSLRDLIEEGMADPLLGKALEHVRALDGLACVDELHDLPLFLGRENLTRREREVLLCVLHGDCNKQIARELGISPRTIENHREHISEKLETPNMAALFRKVLNNR